MGNVSVLSPEPVLMHNREWRWLCRQAESASRELLALEQEIVGRNDLQELLGIPVNLRRLLQGKSQEARPVVRAFRFDFHPTAKGWMLSEVNSDVPGGYGEASTLTSLYGQHSSGLVAPPDPLVIWADAVESVAMGKVVALLYAPGFMEDEQVVRSQAKELGRRGFQTYLIQSPFALKWNRGRAVLRKSPATAIDILVRFYQVEWLTQLPVWTGWKGMFHGGNDTLVLNPVVSAISESKRLPLCWPYVSERASAFRDLLPETCEPANIVGMTREDWVLKAAYSNTGDDVHLGASKTAYEWSNLLGNAVRQPRRWVAQRRFDTSELCSKGGLVKPCVGVYVINGCAAGAYVRLSRRQVTDGYALEAPLFLSDFEEDGWIANRLG
ncbi:glutathionylspermidine synthase family protein [Silvibacterium acidisoli]|uniref:glutathionylspermidine synthase family protein n=1 Tax=Acidobacteriaceae bacterium ZG23-2 TaxID=2883246 RepID=UPI00406CD482